MCFSADGGRRAARYLSASKRGWIAGGSRAKKSLFGEGGGQPFDLDYESLLLGSSDPPDCEELD